MKALKDLAIAVFSVAVPAGALFAQQGAPQAWPPDQIIERASPAVVLVFVGTGDGQIAATGSGLIVRPDGVILTANHLIKGMNEVQVRLRSGEVFDQVQLITADERRDVAALRIPAVDLPVLQVATSGDAQSGAAVFVVSNPAGLQPTATAGVLDALKMADEVSGAGNGYRLLQFTAPLSAGASGGVLVDAQARALGIVLGPASPVRNVNYAVPLDNVVGLAAASGGTPLGSGSRLKATAPVARSSRSLIAPPVPVPAQGRTDQAQIRTVSVLSKTIYLRRERLQDDLQKTDLFKRMGFRFADYGETADVAVTVDRPVLTFDWTYTLVYQPSSLTLATGMVEAADEFDAGPKLAAQIVEKLADAALMPRSALAGPATARGRAGARAGSGRDPGEVLRTCKTIFVESHTIWMKGNLLQDALYIRPELKEWGLRIVDDRNSADVYVDVTRPFLTWDWDYKMVDIGTGAVVGSGRVLAIDGQAAATRIAAEIVKRIQAVRPLAPAKQP